MGPSDRLLDAYDPNNGWMLIQVQNPCLYLVWSIGLFLKIQFSPLIPADAFKAILWSRFQASDWSHATKTQN